MTPDREDPELTDPELTELLHATGQVDPPPPESLDNARESLWSAIAEELFFTDDPPATRARPQPNHRAQRPDQHRRANPGG